MRHKRFCVRKGCFYAHLYPPKATKGQYSMRSFCGITSSYHAMAEPGDGRMVCKVCAKIARKVGALDAYLQNL